MKKTILISFILVGLINLFEAPGQASDCSDGDPLCTKIEGETGTYGSLEKDCKNVRSKLSQNIIFAEWTRSERNTCAWMIRNEDAQSLSLEKKKLDKEEQKTSRAELRDEHAANVMTWLRDRICSGTDAMPTEVSMLIRHARDEIVRTSSLGECKMSYSTLDKLLNSIEVKNTRAIFTLLTANTEGTLLQYLTVRGSTEALKMARNSVKIGLSGKQPQLESKLSALLSIRELLQENAEKISFSDLCNSTKSTLEKLEERLAKASSASDFRNFDRMLDRAISTVAEKAAGPNCETSKSRLDAVFSSLRPGLELNLVLERFQSFSEDDYSGMASRLPGKNLLKASRVFESYKLKKTAEIVRTLARLNEVPAANSDNPYANADTAGCAKAKALFNATKNSGASSGPTDANGDLLPGISGVELILESEMVAFYKKRFASCL